MPTSATGSDRSRGFTLLELLIVVALIAVAASVTVLSMRDPAATRLEREAGRLAALLEAARAQSRAQGAEVRWRPRGEREVLPDAPGAAPSDFVFIGLPPDHDLPRRWLEPGVGVSLPDPRGVLLGPEPVIGAQRVLLFIGEQRMALVTDGLGPFRPETEATGMPAGANGGTR
jgi:general secretion pathway protein H